MAVAFALVVADLFKVTDDKVGSAQFLLLVVGAAWAIQFPSNVAMGVLLGYERYDASNAIDILTRLVEGIATVAVLVVGAGVEALAIVLFCAETARAVARVVYTSLTIPQFRFRRQSFNLRFLRDGRNFSYCVGAANSVVSSRADHLIIGAFLPLSAVGIYGVGMRLVSLSQVSGDSAKPCLGTFSREIGQRA